MAETSAIEWTDATWNPIVGCSLVSPACTNCYAMAMAARIERMKPDSHYAGTTKVANGKPVWTGELKRAPNAILRRPLAWKRPRKIFVNSMSDLFHERVPVDLIDDIFAVMALAPQHTFQILTKRPARMREYLTDPETPNHLESLLTIIDNPGATSLTWPLPNVWLGVTAEDQKRADERRDDFKSLAEFGWTTFVSYEPALGPVDWMGWEFVRQIIFGDESGPNSRPPHPQWARDTRDFCDDAGVAFFMKQMRIDGKLIKDIDSFPIDLQVREF
jgi:protein gp37